MIEKIFFYLFIFSIPFQSRLIIQEWGVVFNEWGSAFLWGTDILFVLLIFAWLLRRIRSKISFTWFRNDLWLLAFWIFAGISIFQADILGISIYRLLKLTEYLLFFLYIRNNIGNIFSITSMTLTLVASAFFQAILGIMQYIFQHDLGLRWLGESVLSIHGEAVAVVVAHSQSFLRAYGTFPHPNLLAVWLMLGLWSGLWYITHENNRFRPWVIATIPIMLIAFLLTFSRVAIIVWFIGSIFLIKNNVRRFVLPVFIFCLLLAGIFSPQLYSRFSFSRYDEAIAQRIFHADIAIAQIREHPFVGIGIGQFVNDLMRRLPHYPDTIYQPAHNLYLLIASEIGILGLFCFLIFLGNSLRILWPNDRRRFVLVFVLLVLAFFDHYFWTLQQGGLVFWGLLGLFFHDKMIQA